MRGRGGDGDGKVDLAAGDQRAGPAFQRRDAGRDGHRRREDHQGQPAARSGRRGRLRRSEPAGQLRHRDRRRRAGLHDGEPRSALRCDASPRGGCDRPAGPAGPARPITAGALGRSATARGDRGRADRVTAAAGPRRAHIRPRSGRSRRGLERTGPSGARSGSDRGHGRTSAGACRAVRRPDHPGAR